MPGEPLEALVIQWQLAKKCFEKPIRQAHQDKMRRFPFRVFIDIALMSVTRKLTMYAVCARAYAERGRILRPPLLELSLA